jgi:hypothetical protein
MLSVHILAARLREAGANMYGAFWCTHCYDQKQEFGQQAMAEFPYVECFPQGWKKVGAQFWLYMCRTGPDIDTQVAARSCKEGSTVGACADTRA